MRSLLPVAVFITGASVLIVEVLAVRVLSPYYGNTIFTVSSVISVILLALSVGYYAGGALADRHPSLGWFFGIILLSGLALLAFQVLGTVVLPPLSAALSIATGPLVSAAVLFLLPALLLGTLSPYAVKLQTVYVPEQGVGSAAGTIFFWSTLGSILGSLLAGFVLIPHFGIDRILVATGAVLFVLGGMPFFVLGLKRTRRYLALIACLLIVVTALWAADRRPGPFGASRPTPFGPGGEPIYTKDGVYQRVTIYDGTYVGRPARLLLLDRSESGAMFLDSDDPTELVYDYTKYYSLYKIFTPRVEHALVLGGGAYSIPKALLHELPAATVDVAEIEPSLFDLAKRYFQAADSLRLHNYVQDGRRFLHDADKKYDLIFGDVYYSYFSVPLQFTTREFFALVRDRLKTEGVFIANMIGDLSRRQPSLIMAEIKTFQAVFPNSYVFAVESPEKTDVLQNITLVGYNSDKTIDLNSAPITTHRDPLIRFLRFKVLDVRRRFELSPYPVLTDNFSPVEYLTAQVLQRSFRERTVLDGDEMRAVVDQLLRYGPWYAAGSTEQDPVQDFLLAEMEGLAQEVKTQRWTQTGPDGMPYERTNIVGRLFSSEERRVVVATHYDQSAPGVAVLVELARSLISSPIVPRVGVDIVFLDGREGEEHVTDLYGSNTPVSTVMLDTVCASDDPCSADTLESAGLAVLKSLNEMQ